MAINKWLIFAGALAISWIWIDNIHAQANNNDILQQIGTQTSKTNEQTYDTLNFPIENTERKTIIVENEENLPEQIESHKDFITTRIDKIFKIYWKEKALELINQHMLIEINKFREENWKPPLKLDLELQELSQERAEKLYNENSCDHWIWNDSLKTRIAQKKIKWIIGGWENLCQWFYTIRDISESFETSETGHKDLYLKDGCNFCWIGIKCSIFYWDNDKTGDTTYIWNRKYRKSNEIFKCNCCITIVQKEEINQEETPEKEE